ncbi:MAG: hypothetical protein PG978_001200 [Wolbachia endosymbiont of Ctenocephalides felis wCfeF]|nr:MAG: hypothetical protein PG978_001200 [Wolbachia endosymbiont of Ctenocephalides felis wCfeF]
MPNSGKLIIEFKVKVIELAKIIRYTSSKFDSLNTKMDEVDIKC